MLHFHANLYAIPEDTAPGPGVWLRGLSLPTLQSTEGGPPRYLATLPVTFEQSQRSLLELPRCDCEPDGFFLLTGHEGETFWRLNGHLHEYEEKLHRVELNGECPNESLDAVLSALGWPEAKLAFELVKEGVSLTEEDFRNYAAAK